MSTSLAVNALGGAAPIAKTSGGGKQKHTVRWQLIEFVATGKFSAEAKASANGKKRKRVEQAEFMSVSVALAALHACLFT